MTKICLVSCASSKQQSKCLAKDLYISPLFRFARAVAEREYDQWFILSAKHGLLSPDEQIAPYDETLITKPTAARERWGRRVLNQLMDKLSPGDTVTFFAGDAYREFLTGPLSEAGFRCELPLGGLGLGQQIHTLKLLSQETERLKRIDDFYESLGRLREVQGKVKLSDLIGARSLPSRGVYFFFEPTEYRLLSKRVLRCVRIGTHAVSRNSQSTLWTRLRTHRGGSDKRGNHRGSIFRLHIGSAMLARGDFPMLTTWGKEQSAPREIRQSEELLEIAVSDYIGNMEVLWLSIPDEPGPDSDRAFVERNAISLLSGPTGPIDLPSREWLGLYSPTNEIKRSGLWNINHVDEAFDPSLLGVVEQYVVGTVCGSKLPGRSIAPANWRKLRLNQLELL